MGNQWVRRALESHQRMLEVFECYRDRGNPRMREPREERMGCREHRALTWLVGLETGGVCVCVCVLGLYSLERSGKTLDLGPQEAFGGSSARCWSKGCGPERWGRLGAPGMPDRASGGGWSRVCGMLGGIVPLTHVCPALSRVAGQGAAGAAGSFLFSWDERVSVPFQFPP